MQTKARTLYLIREVLSVAGMGVALFWSGAGWTGGRPGPASR